MESDKESQRLYSNVEYTLPVRILIWYRMWRDNAGHLEPSGELVQGLSKEDAILYYDDLARKSLWTLALYSIVPFSMVWVIVSWFRDVKLGHHDWFAPSGAILVIASVCSNIFSPPRENWCLPIFSRLRSAALIGMHKVNVIQGYVFAILGALIWAYGDKAYSFLLLS